MDHSSFRMMVLFVIGLSGMIHCSESKNLKKICLFAGLYLIGFFSHRIFFSKEIQMQNSDSQSENVASQSESLSNSSSDEEHIDMSLFVENKSKINDEKKFQKQNAEIVMLRKKIRFLEQQVQNFQNEKSEIDHSQEPVNEPENELPMLHPKKSKATKMTLAQLEENDHPDTERKFLESNSEKDLISKISKLGPPTSMDGIFQSIQGVFRGQIVNDKSEPMMTLSLELDFSVEAGKLNGRYQMLMEGSGNRSSRTSDRSDGRDTFWQEPGKADEIFIKTGPDTFIQLFYLRSTDRLIGNYYKGEAPAKMNKEGTIQLSRAG